MSKGRTLKFCGLTGRHFEPAVVNTVQCTVHIESNSFGSSAATPGTSWVQPQCAAAVKTAGSNNVNGKNIEVLQLTGRHFEAQSLSQG